MIFAIGILFVPASLAQGLPVIADCNYESNFMISTNTLEFTRGETFVMNMKTVQNDTTFEVVVINPNEQEVFADIVDADKSGSTQTRFHIPDDAQKGTWSVFLTANPSHLQEVIFIGVDEIPQSLLSIKPSFVNHQYKADDASFLIVGEPDMNVQVNVSDPNSGEKSIYIVTLPPQGKCNFILDLDGYKPGVYDVEIRNNNYDDRKTTTFNIGLHPSRGIIDIRTSSNTYFSGDAVFLLGDTAANTDLTIEVFDPSENITSKFFIASDETGMINTSFHLPDDAMHGTWKVKASSSPNFDSVEFAVIEDTQDKKTSNKDLESPDAVQNCEWAKDGLTERPHSCHALCDLQQCMEPTSTVKERTRIQIAEQKIMLENDYIVQQFLRKHSEITLDDSPIHIVNNQRPITWEITAPQDLESVKETEDFRYNLKNSDKTMNVGKLYVNFDNCSYVTEYSYDVTDEKNDSIKATYPFDDTDLENIATFEEERYHLAETIMERHMPPKVQMTEFNILPDWIQCNQGLELIQKYDNSPTCVNVESIPKLTERGWAAIISADRFESDNISKDAFLTDSTIQDMLDQLRTTPRIESMQNFTDAARDFIISESVNDQKVLDLIKDYDYDITCCSFGMDRNVPSLNRYVGVVFDVDEKYMSIATTYDLKQEKVTHATPRFVTEDDVLRIGDKNEN